LNADLKLVVFDMDGTLIDSQAIILEAMRRGFASAGHDAPADAATLSIVGLSLRPDRRRRRSTRWPRRTSRASSISAARTARRLGARSIQAPAPRSTGWRAGERR
jgi:phosphoglycolate phosphatase-like HAD superfamily hydrolase